MRDRSVEGIQKNLRFTNKNVNKEIIEKIDLLLKSIEDARKTNNPANYIIKNKIFDEARKRLTDIRAGLKYILILTSNDRTIEGMTEEQAWNRLFISIDRHLPYLVREAENPRIPLPANDIDFVISRLAAYQQSSEALLVREIYAEVVPPIETRIQKISQQSNSSHDRSSTDNEEIRATNLNLQQNHSNNPHDESNKDNEEDNDFLFLPSVNNLKSALVKENKNQADAIFRISNELKKDAKLSNFNYILNFRFVVNYFKKRHLRNYQADYIASSKLLNIIGQAREACVIGDRDPSPKIMRIFSGSNYILRKSHTLSEEIKTSLQHFINNKKQDEDKIIEIKYEALRQKDEDGYQKLHYAQCLHHQKILKDTKEQHEAQLKEILNYYEAKLNGEGNSGSTSNDINFDYKAQIKLLEKEIQKLKSELNKKENENVSIKEQQEDVRNSSSTPETPNKLPELLAVLPHTPSRRQSQQNSLLSPRKKSESAVIFGSPENLPDPDSIPTPHYESESSGSPNTRRKSDGDEAESTLSITFQTPNSKGKNRKEAFYQSSQGTGITTYDKNNLISRASPGNNGRRNSVVTFASNDTDNKTRSLRLGAGAGSSSDSG